MKEKVVNPKKVNRGDALRDEIEKFLFTRCAGQWTSNGAEKMTLG